VEGQYVSNGKARARTRRRRWNVRTRSGGIDEKGNRDRRVRDSLWEGEEKNIMFSGREHEGATEEEQVQVLLTGTE
jgi:hypothetical protein